MARIGFIVDDNFIGNKKKLKTETCQPIEWQEKASLRFFH
jgi:hypothetical protein